MKSIDYWFRCMLEKSIREVFLSKKTDNEEKLSFLLYCISNYEGELQLIYIYMSRKTLIYLRTRVTHKVK